MQTLFDQTSWDNPSLINERLGQAQRGAAIELQALQARFDRVVGEAAAGPVQARDAAIGR